MRTATANLSTPTGTVDEPLDAATCSAIASCILLLIVLIAGAFAGVLAALATAAALFIGCGAALILLVLHGFPPDDLPEN